MLKNNMLLNKKFTSIFVACLLSLGAVNVDAKDNLIKLETYYNEKKQKNKLTYVLVGKSLYVEKNNLPILKLNKNKIKKIKGKNFYLVQTDNISYKIKNNKIYFTKEQKLPDIKIVLPKKTMEELLLEKNLAYINILKPNSESKIIDEVLPPINILKPNFQPTNENLKEDNVAVKKVEIPVQKKHKEVLLLETTLNEVNLGKVISFVYDNKENKIYINEKNIKDLNLKRDSSIIVFDNERFYELSKNYISYIIDEENQSIKININREQFAKNNIEVSEQRIKEVKEKINNKNIYTKDSGLYVNYDAYLNKDKDNQSLNGVVSTNYFNEFGEGEIGVLAKSVETKDTKDSEAIRLNSTWVKNDLDNNKTYSFGDITTSKSSIGKSVYLGGIGISKNYTLTPGFVKYATPPITGYSSSPSIVDVYINNLNKETFNVAPGEYSINNIPSISGVGNARVVVKDLLGREQVYQNDLFVSPKVLKKDLSEYSFNLGFERFNYGIKSADYRDLAFIGNYSYGLTNNFTLEYRGEAKKDYVGSGLAGYYKVENINTVFDAKVWGNKVLDLNGNMYGVGSTTSFKDLSFRLSYDKFSKNYYQIGMRDFNEGLFSERESTFLASLNINPAKMIGRNIGNFGISYVENKNFNQEAEKIVGLNYTKNITPQLSLSANYLSNIKDSSRNILFVGLNYYFDKQNIVTNISEIDGEISTDVSYYKSPSEAEGDNVGYGLSVGDNRYKASGQYRHDAGNVAGSVYSNKGNTGINVSASGGVVVMKNKVIPTKKIDSSFAIIETGFPNIEVSHQNKKSLKTDSDGVVLIPNLTPNIANKIDFNKNLPLNIETIQELEVYPSINKKGYVRKIKIEEKNSFMLLAKKMNGKDIDSGSLVRTFDQDGNILENDLFVALGGLVYGNKANKVSRVEIDYIENNKPITCVIELNNLQKNKDLINLGNKTCK